MAPESVGEFALRLHGLGPKDDQTNNPNPTSDPLGYLLNAAKITKHDLYQSLLTNDTPENMRQAMFRSVPSSVGATVGGIAGANVGALAGLGIGAGPGAYLGMGVGGAGGEFLRQGAVGLNAALTGSTPQPSPLQVALGGAKEGAINALVPAAASPLVKTAGKAISGASSMTMDRLLERPSQVATSAMLNPDAAPTLAKQFVDAVNSNMDRAGDAYKGLIDQVMKSGKYGENFTLNLRDGLMDTIGQARKDFGYGLPGRLAEESEANVFNKFANATQKMDSATPEEAYYFQRDLNNAMRSNVGKPVSAALGRLKGQVVDILGNSIPEIGAANNIYKTASDLSDELSRVTNADNALGVIKNALKNKSNTFDALGQAADSISSGRQLLESIKDAMAGGELSPMVANLPRTGLTAGLGMLGYGAATTHNPVATAGSAALAPFLSPRLVAYGTRVAMSAPGQLAERPVISSLLNQLLPQNTQSEQPLKVESVGDFALRLHGLGGNTK